MEDIKHLLSRLEVLTDLTEFAEKQRAMRSPYVDGWANDEWYKEIAQLRTALPDDTVQEFDNARNRKQRFIDGCS